MEKDKTRKLILIIILIIIIAVGIYIYIPLLIKEEKKDSQNVAKPVASSETVKEIKQDSKKETIETLSSKHDIKSLKDPFLNYPFYKTQLREKSPSPGVESLELKGIIRYKSGYLALIKYTDLYDSRRNKYMTIKEGDKLGYLNGIVTKITSDSVEIQEIITSPDGKKQKTKLTLKLRTEEGL